MKFKLSKLFEHNRHISLPINDIEHTINLFTIEIGDIASVLQVQRWILTLFKKEDFFIRKMKKRYQKYCTKSSIWFLMALLFLFNPVFFVNIS